MSENPLSRNASFGAIAIFIGALGSGTMALLPVQLAPISLLFLGLVTFGLWALSAEMGMEKPLVRGAFVAFAFAAMAKSQALLNLNPEEIVRYYIFYAFSILLALFLWSVAFLHRQKELKIVGALGAVATITPLFFLIVGHIVIGVGGAFGITALFAISEGGHQTKFTAVNNIDFIFTGWALVASLMLWRGRFHPAM